MNVFSEPRPAIAVAALGFLLLNLTLASLMFVAVYDFDAGLFAQHGALFERGPGSAGLLRIGSVIDMAGYLALAPVVLYVHGRVDLAVRERGRSIGLEAVVTATGLGFVLVGAVGAALMASAAPWLLEQAGGGSADQAVARAQFAALESVVFVGLWGALGLGLLSSWILGVSAAARAEGRAFSSVGVIAGLGALAYALRCGLTGDTPFALTSPLDLLILASVGFVWPWTAWLALRLWRGR